MYYTDPCDLFLNGVMDRRRGTCGNMAALHVAMGWRMGWPVSLACIKSHFICRYDDGRVQHNIETTHPSTGGFKSDPDEFIIREEGLTAKAISTGSDLRAVKPRELLGLFLGLKGRHLRDIGERAEAEKSYLVARYLFPSNHNLYFTAMGVSVMRGEELFSVEDEGHPLDLANWIVRWYANSQDLRAANLPFHIATPVEPLTEATKMTDSLFMDFAFEEREDQ